MPGTKDKSNACKIRSRVHQAVFKAFLGNDDRATWLSGMCNRPELSAIADLATKAVMQETRLEIVLKKKDDGEKL